MTGALSDSKQFDSALPLRPFRRNNNCHGRTDGQTKSWHNTAFVSLRGNLGSSAVWSRTTSTTSNKSSTTAEMADRGYTKTKIFYRCRLSLCDKTGCNTTCPPCSVTDLPISHTYYCYTTLGNTSCCIEQDSTPANRAR